MKTFSESIVNSKTVCCNGVHDNTMSAVLGHPKIYLKIDKNNEVVCPYCSHKFILNKTN